MKPYTKTVLVYSGIFLLLLLIQWWVFTLSGFNIPEYIPDTTARISGLFLGTIIISTLIISQKKIFKTDPNISVFKLTFTGALISFISEVFFQFIRSFTLLEDKVVLFLRGVFAVTIFCTVISFLIAYQLKTKRTGRLILFLALFIFAFIILARVFNWNTT